MPMNASILPREAASKQSNAGMIWPPGKTSIRNRPLVVSSTSFASRSAAPWFTSIAGVHAVDIRHCTFGWATTLGAPTSVAATAPPAVARNLRRFVVISSRHELMVGALRDVIPRAHQRLEPRVRRVHLPGHRRSLGFFLDDVGRQFPELAQHWNRDLENLDLALELRLEPIERD